jgi:hypothetical protein
MIQKINISLVNLILKLKDVKEIPVQVKVKKEQKLDLKKIQSNQDKLKDNKIVTVKTKIRENKRTQRQEPNQLNQFVIGTEVLHKY